MQNKSLTDTIAAIATSLGESGIGIVRISGKDALAITDRIFLSKDGRRPSGFATYTLHYGWIIENQNSAKLREYIDEVILTVMRAPRSYTREDVVEINCHGGMVAIRRILELVLAKGARLADPGEFTKRAFLNGRIDLAQAEAVLEIIRAKTDFALKMGTAQLKGGLSLKIRNTREALLEALAHLEAGIDFPQEEIGTLNLEALGRTIKQINNELKNILDNSRQARILREGIHVVICGKPNAGKSSLLNALLKEERSIVTPVAGTTRDTIEEILDIKGIPVRIVDTAGILEPRDLIEKKSVQRSRKQITLADLAILLFDGSKKMSREDAILMRRLKRKNVIAVINKLDLKQKIAREKIVAHFKQVVEISAKKGKNIHLLEEAIARSVYGDHINMQEPVLVGSLRQMTALKEAQKFVAGAIESLDRKLSLEFIAQDIKEGLGYLDQTLGKSFSQDLLDKIFADFCIGK